MKRFAIQLMVVGVLLVWCSASAEAVPAPPLTPSAVRVNTPFAIKGSQQPQAPYTLAGTLHFQHLAAGAWQDSGDQSAHSDAVPLLTRPLLGTSAPLVSAVPTGGPDENRLMVSALGPNCGIGSTDTTQPVSMMVSEGTAYWQSSRTDGSSVSFVGRPFQAPFVRHNVKMTVIHAPVEMRSPSGSLLQVFHASSAGEMIATGNLYIRRDGSLPALLKAEPGKRIVVRAPFVPTPRGWLMTHMVRDATRDQAVHVSLWDPELRVEYYDRVLCARPGYNYQAYSAVRCSNGSIVVPFAYTRTATFGHGLWTMDVEVSDDDGATWTPLNQPRTIAEDATTQPGIMEAEAVEITPGQLAILFRCAAGYVGRVDLDLESRTLGQPYLTDLVAPLTGLAALRLDSGTIALAWNGCKPLDGTPKLPRKVIVLGLSEDGLRSFSSVHVVCTSESFGDSLLAATPYVHQPELAQIDGLLRVGVDRVVRGNDIRPYLYQQKGELLVRNVVGADGTWRQAAVDPAAARLDLLAAFGPASFEALNMIGPQSTWSATATVPTGGRWRVRLVDESGASPWSSFLADQAKWTRLTLSNPTVTYAHPALMTGRLLSAAGEPLGEMPVQVLRNGSPVMTRTSAADGTVRVKVRHSKAASWRFRFAGTDSIAGVLSRAMRTVPKYAIRVAVPASGAGSGRGYLSRGVAYGIVANGDLRSVRLLGPSGATLRLASKTTHFSVPASGYYTARVLMPGGGTLTIW